MTSSRVATPEELKNWNPTNGISGSVPMSESDLWKPEGRSEAANARRFIERRGADLRWCEPWKVWLAWDDLHWGIDQERRAEAMMKDEAQNTWALVGRMLPDVGRELAQELVRFGKSSNQANGIRNALALARSEPGVPILPAVLDRDPWLLNVKNGTIDLRTITIRPHNRADLITKVALIAYNPAADCPTWIRVVHEIFNGDKALIKYVRKLVGYCLTGSTAEHILPFLYGTGANGKSLFLGTILALMGEDYSMKAPPDLLMAKKGNTHPTERADLFGKRFVAAIEAEDGRRLAEALVKELSGGDKVRARRMQENFWEFHATHKIWLAANHKPTIRGTDHGIWRRVKLIPFTVTFPPDQQDKALPEKLKAELPGILNWALLGCMEWQAEGLGEPEAVVTATDSYKSEMDIVGAFIDECCFVRTDAKAWASDLYAAFVKWCEKNAERAVKQTEFGTRLGNRGYADSRGTGGRVQRHGIGLLTDQK